MKQKNKIRIYVANKLICGQEFTLSEDKSHYLCNVMRLPAGAFISCFNSQDGEFDSQIVNINKKQTIVLPVAQIRQPTQEPDVWLLFAPLKKDRMDFLIEKAVELGVSKLVPVITEYSITDKIRLERLQAQVIEASEQCERLSVPEVCPAVGLNAVIKEWDDSRCLFFMDERGAGASIKQAFAQNQSDSIAIIIGPEGGFASAEADMLYSKKYVIPVSLGPRILRAETAAVASVALWQAICGDWNQIKGDRK